MNYSEFDVVCSFEAGGISLVNCLWSIQNWSWNVVKWHSPQKFLVFNALQRFINISLKLKTIDLIKFVLKLSIIGVALIIIGTLNSVLLAAQSQEVEDVKIFENITILIEKGDEFYGLNQYEEALRYYDKALTINKTNTYALASKGDSLNHLGKYHEAINYIEFRNSTITT